MLWLLLSILFSATLVVLSEHECAKSSYDGISRALYNNGITYEVQDECKCVAEVVNEVIQQGRLLGGASSNSELASECEDGFSEYAEMLTSWSTKCDGTEESKGKPDDDLIQHIENQCSGDGDSCKFENGNCIPDH